MSIVYKKKGEGTGLIRKNLVVTGNAVTMDKKADVQNITFISGDTEITLPADVQNKEITLNIDCDATDRIITFKNGTETSKVKLAADSHNVFIISANNTDFIMQRKSTEYPDLTDDEIRDGVLDEDLSLTKFQTIEEKSLTTTAKNVPEAINELNAQFKDIVNNKATKQELEVERARINTFTTLKAGSTTGDAELIDARVGADGITYENIGVANRTQFSTIKDCLTKESTETTDKITGVTSLPYCVYQDSTHGYGSDKAAKKFYISGQSKILVTGSCGGNFPLVCFFSEDNGEGFISSYMSATPFVVITETVAVPKGAKYCIVNDEEKKCPEIKCEIKHQTKVLFKPEDISNDILTTDMQNLFIREYDSKGMDFKPFEKNKVVLVVDDGSEQTPDIYQVCHELGIPMSVAVPWNRLSAVYTRDSNPNNLSIKDFCKLIEKDGGEVLSHGWTVITDTSTEADYIDVFVTEKKKMQENGFACRGKILIGGADYISNDPRTDKWVKLNYEYSDLYGLKSSKMYYLDRLWFGDWTNLENFKGKLNEIKNGTPKIILLSMHGSNDETKFEHAKNVKGLLEYMKTLEFIEFTTIAKVYDEYAYAKFK